MILLLAPDSFARSSVRGEIDSLDFVRPPIWLSSNWLMLSFSVSSFVNTSNSAGLNEYGLVLMVNFGRDGAFIRLDFTSNCGSSASLCWFKSVSFGRK